MRVFIFTNGDYENEAFYKEALKSADLIICADGGGYYLYKWGIKPHILIGDMDSIPEEALRFFEESRVLIKEFPPYKDYTDTHLALIEALEHEPSEVTIIGGVGKRLDHILGNVHLLFFALRRGVKAKLLNEFYEVTLLSPGESLIQVRGKKISVLPLTPEVEFSHSEGLKWPLSGLKLSLEHPIGISNEPLSSLIKVEVRMGIAILFQVMEV